MLLGQVLHRMGDVRGAIATLELVVAERCRRRGRARRRSNAGDGSSSSTIACSRRSASASPSPSKDRRSSAGERGPRVARSRVLADWRTCSAPIPTTADLGGALHAEQFRDITRSPAWAAGAYDGTIRVPMRGALDNRERARSRARARVRPRAGPHAGGPGRADVAERGARLGARSRRSTGPASACARAGAGVAAARCGPRFGRLDGAQAQVAYATSALAVRRLLDEAGGVAIANLLRDLGEGVDFDEAFLHRMQRPFARLPDKRGTRAVDPLNQDQPASC